MINKRTSFKEKGITLIALVITIIVLLILVGITFSMLNGDNNIISKAQQAKEYTIEAEERDALSMAYADYMINSQNKENNINTSAEMYIENSLRKIGYESRVLVMDDILNVTFANTNHKYKLSIKTGKIEIINPMQAKNESKIIDITDRLILNDAGQVIEFTFGPEDVYYEYYDEIEKEEKIIAENAKAIQGYGYVDNNDTLYLLDINKKIDNVESYDIRYSTDTSQNYAIDKNGKLYVWGRNYDGCLGIGTESNSSEPICLNDLDGNALSGKKIVKADINYENGYAIDSNGKLYTWGNNSDGELGNGQNERSLTPICISDIQGNALYGKKIVEASIDCASLNYAIDDQGKLYVWGSLYFANIGDGVNERSRTPICISDVNGSPLNGKRIVQANVGSSCSAIDENGDLYVWGDNDNGQLGNGTTEESWLPVCITNIETSPLNNKKIKNAYVDSYRSYAIDNNGKLYLWGFNCNNEVIDETTDDITIPICVSDMENSFFSNKKIKYYINSDGCVLENDEISYKSGYSSEILQKLNSNSIIKETANLYLTKSGRIIVHLDHSPVDM